MVRTYGLEPFEVGAHLARLAASAGRIALRLPWDGSRLEREIRRVVDASRGGDETDPAGAPWNQGERSVRVVVTRGSGEMGLDPGLATEPAVVVMALPLRGPPLSAYREGVSAWPFGGPEGPGRGGDPAAKTGEHLFHVLAVGEARTHGAHEALLVDRGGFVTEGASSNLFTVREGVLSTPPLQAGILAGVTRALVLGLARTLEMSALQEQPLPLAALDAADEAFLTSTVREVLRWSAWETGRWAGAPGAVTGRIHAAFRRLAGGHKPGKVRGPG